MAGFWGRRKRETEQQQAEDAELTRHADAALVRDLIAMGPNAFHGVPEEVDPIDTEVAVSVWLFRRLG